MASEFRKGSIVEQVAYKRWSSAIWQEAELVQSQSWMFVTSAIGQKRTFRINTFDSSESLILAVRAYQFSLSSQFRVLSSLNLTKCNQASFKCRFKIGVPLAK
jgi:hypothetical protein